MKPNKIIIPIVTVIVLACSCQKKNCSEIRMFENPPAVSATDYNTCATVFYNYSAYTGEGLDRLAAMDFKDTIKVCGYITDCTKSYARGSCLYSLMDESPTLGTRPTVQIPLRNFVPDSITTQKIYVTGILNFEIDRRNMDKSTPCDKIFPMLLPIDYHFE